jgi:hypothetical protein
MRYVIALLALLLAGPAWAIDGTTTGELRSLCSTHRLYCLGFIAGVFELAQHEKVICPQLDVSGGAAVQIFLNWADQNPKFWGMTRREGTLAALSAAFPCKP